MPVMFAARKTDEQVALQNVFAVNAHARNFYVFEVHGLQVRRFAQQTAQ